MLWKPTGTPEPFKDFLLLLQQSGSRLFPRGNQILTPRGLLHSVPNLARSEAEVDPDLLQWQGRRGLQAKRPPLLAHPMPPKMEKGPGEGERESSHGLEGKGPASGGTQANREATVDPGSTHVFHGPQAASSQLLLGRTEIKPHCWGLFQKMTRK